MDLTPSEWRERDARALADLQAQATAQPYEKEFFRKDASRVPVLVGGALFEDGGNEVVAFVLELSEQKAGRSRESGPQGGSSIVRIWCSGRGRPGLDVREIVGSSTALKAVLSRVAKVAPTDSSVFITGETGTGRN